MFPFRKSILAGLLVGIAAGVSADVWAASVREREREAREFAERMQDAEDRAAGKRPQKRYGRFRVYGFPPFIWRIDESVPRSFPFTWSVVGAALGPMIIVAFQMRNMKIRFVKASDDFRRYRMRPGSTKH
jgi:hypothetical protein